MKGITFLHKFYKRYEVDLWGRIGLSHNKKIIKYLEKIYEEKENYLSYQNRFKRKSKYFESNLNNKFDLKKNEKMIFKSNLLYIPSNKKKRFRKFVYRIDINEPKRKRLKTTFSRELFILNKKLRSFYGNIKRFQLRKYALNKTYNFKLKIKRGFNYNKILNYISKKKNIKVSAINSFLSLLEHRLDIFLYRCNFVQTIYEARNYIKYKKILVNNKYICSCSYHINNFDFIKLDKINELLIFKNLKKKIKICRLLSYVPSYIIVDYSLMISSIIKNPTYNLVPFPFSIDLKKWLGLAKMQY